MDWQNIIFVVGFFLLFILGTVLMALNRKRIRRTEIPFGREARLLRNAGESQLELVRRMDDRDLLWIGLGASIPALALGLMLSAFGWFSGYFQVAWFILSIVVFVFLFGLAMHRFALSLEERSDRYLGYFGERYIADCLEPLKQKGSYVFHDLPAEGKRRDFNLDHVVVGLTGVYVVETKTWRKKKGGGKAGASVSYDGRNLRGPRGVNNKPIEQVEANAKWLRENLKADTGLDVNVRPVLTFPEWGVEFDLSAPDKRETRVVISGSLEKFLIGGYRTLEQPEVEKIAIALKDRCRTVAY